MRTLLEPIMEVEIIETGRRIPGRMSRRQAYSQLSDIDEWTVTGVQTGERVGRELSRRRAFLDLSDVEGFFPDPESCIEPADHMSLFMLTGWMGSSGTELVVATSIRSIFTGAGGLALLALQETWSPQAMSYMTLPVTGKCAVFQKPNAVQQHAFKVLRTGSSLDAVIALQHHSICAVLDALSKNVCLQGGVLAIQPRHQKADPEDRALIPAGIRAQTIGGDPRTRKGMLQLLFEVVASDHGTIVRSLGATPLTSTCVSMGLHGLCVLPTQNQSTQSCPRTRGSRSEAGRQMLVLMTAL